MDTRERLMAAAGNLVDQFGVHDVGLDVILREANVSKTTFYKYFASKDELAVAAVENCGQTAVAKIKSKLEIGGGSSLEEALVEFFYAWDDALFSSELEGCLFFKVCSEYPNPNDAMHQAGQTFPLAIETIISDLLASHQVGNPKLATDTLMMILHGYASYKFINKHHDLRSVAEFMIRRTAALLGTKDKWIEATNRIGASG